MNFERNDYYRDLNSIHDDCKRCLYYHAILTMNDGSTFDGIIEDVDMDKVTALIGEDVIEGEEENNSNGQRQFYGHGRPRKRYRRFRRHSFPLRNLATLALLPYIAPPPYPYYPYY